MKNMIRNVKGTARVAQNTSAIIKAGEEFDFRQMAKDQMGMNDEEANRVHNGVSVIKDIAQGRLDLRGPILDALKKHKEELARLKNQEQETIVRIEHIAQSLGAMG